MKKQKLPEVILKYKILVLLALSMVIGLFLNSCVNRDWGKIKFGKISNMYTQDQIDPLMKDDFNKLGRQMERVHQNNSFSYFKGMLLTAYLKAGFPGTTEGQNTDKFNEIFTNLLSSVDSDSEFSINTKPDIAYRYLIDDLCSNYEYEQTAKLKFQYKYLIGRSYKIFYIPIIFSLFPGKRTYEDYYANIEFRISSDTTLDSNATPNIQLLDLFPSKIFDNRRNNYSGSFMDSLFLSGSAELTTPKGGGALGSNYQGIENITEISNNLQRIPIIVSYIDCLDISENTDTINFGWNIYPERTLVDGEFLNIMNPNIYNFVAVVAVQDKKELKIKYKLEGKGTWRILTQEKKWWYWRYLNPDDWFGFGWGHDSHVNLDSSWGNGYDDDFKPLCPFYDPIDKFTPVITGCDTSVYNHMVEITGTDLDFIDTDQKVSLLVSGNNEPISSIDLDSLYINKDTNKAIGIINTDSANNKRIYAASFYSDRTDTKKANEEGITDNVYIVLRNESTDKKKTNNENDKAYISLFSINNCQFTK